MDALKHKNKYNLHKMIITLNEIEINWNCLETEVVLSCFWAVPLIVF